MKILLLKIIFIFILLGIKLTWPDFAFAQEDTLTSLRTDYALYQVNHLQEKIYVHIAGNFHVAGETLFMKVYLVNALDNHSLDMSKTAYAELLDIDNIAVAQCKISLNQGVGSASLDIPPKLNAGNYSLRCYTNWMKNYDEASFFHTGITIANAIKLFPNKEKKVSSYELNFFPEGGNLVQGITSKLAFKVCNEEGRGVDFNGAILNNRKDTLIKFSPLKFGMGNCKFTPQPNEVYHAVVLINDAGKKIKIEKDLPRILDRGYVLHLENFGADLIKVEVTTGTQELNATDNLVYLLAQTRMDVRVAEYGVLREGKATFIFPSKKLGEGISHITLFDHTKKAQCDRLYFKPSVKNLNFDLTLNKQNFKTREQVSIQGICIDELSKGTEAEVSMSVFLTDSLEGIPDEDIKSYLFLSSEIKGHLEAPLYYFDESEKNGKQAIENLLLTQGWSRFTEADKKSSFDHIPEYYSQLIRAKITDAKTGKPVQGVTTFLSTIGRNFQFLNDKSDEKGNVYFQINDLTGYHELIIQTSPRDSNLVIRVEDNYSNEKLGFLPASMEISERRGPEILTRCLNASVENAYLKDRKNIKKISISDTIPFQGTPDQSYLLDDYTRFPTMEEVFREITRSILVKKNSGKFNLSVINKLKNEVYPGDPLVLLDGVPVVADQLVHFDPKKIKKITILQSKFHLGAVDASGIINCITYTEDLSGFELPHEAILIPFIGLNATKEFYAPQYNSDSLIRSRIPDFRTLLHWSPDLKVDSAGKFHESFFTSDHVGQYLIWLQGISKEGRMGSKILKINVQETLH